jgi:hypothetical protein
MQRIVPAQFTCSSEIVPAGRPALTAGGWQAVLRDIGGQ